MTLLPTRAVPFALLAILAGTAATARPAAAAGAAELRGSLRSMHGQHGVAVNQGFAFIRTSGQLENAVSEGALVPVESNDDLLVHSQVTHRYAVPEVRLLIERLAAQYREATGERLVVTSLVRPIAEQPGNAHRLSVHPAGMAIDLRVPARASSRQWLERALLGMERARVLDVTREYRPPHYHVAVFPAAYEAYVAPRLATEAREAAEAAEQAALEAESRRLAALAAAHEDAGDAPVVEAAGTERGATASSGAVMLAVGAGLVAIPLARRRRANRG